MDVKELMNLEQMRNIQLQIVTIIIKIQSVNYLFKILRRKIRC